jgi:SAM-dependent methyltransferase
MKFADRDQRYFERRSAFAERLKWPMLYEIVDQWPLYVGTGNLARTLAIIELFSLTLDVPGDIAEFGVWKGSTSSLLAKVLAIKDPHSPKKIHLFDSFEGLTAFSDEDKVAQGRKGDYLGSEEVLLSSAAVNEIDDYFVVHKGLIEDTLPHYLKTATQTRFSFAYCDTDLYSSTNIILRQMWTRLTPGGLMVFDEWNSDDFPGEGTAVNEFLDEIRPKAEFVLPPQTRQPSLALRKTRDT